MNISNIFLYCKLTIKSVSVERIFLQHNCVRLFGTDRLYFKIAMYTFNDYLLDNFNNNHNRCVCNNKILSDPVI